MNSRGSVFPRRLQEARLKAAEQERERQAENQRLLVRNLSYGESSSSQMFPGF